MYSGSYGFGIYACENHSRKVTRLLEQHFIYLNNLRRRYVSKNAEVCVCVCGVKI
jgi:hypothetical protein